MMYSENVLLEAQSNNFFISRKSHVLFNASFYTWNKSISFESRKVMMMSISIHGRVHSWIYIWVLNHLIGKHGQLTVLVMGYVFRKYLAQFRGLCLKSGPFLFYQPTTIKTLLWVCFFNLPTYYNQNAIMSLYF